MEHARGRGCEKGACEARSRWEEEVDAGSSSRTSNAEIVRTPPLLPSGRRRRQPICFVLAPRRWRASPASPGLASGLTAPGTQSGPLLGQAPSLHFSSPLVTKTRVSNGGKDRPDKASRPRLPQAYSCSTLRRPTKRNAVRPENFFTSLSGGFRRCSRGAMRNAG